MRKMRPRLFLIPALFLFLTIPAFSGESEIVKRFKDARVANEEKDMISTIVENKDKIPGEINVLLDQATVPGATEEDKTGNFYLAELMATIYKDQFGDPEPLRGVKRRYFDTLLSPPVRPTPADGVHTVEMPAPAENHANIFKPDNIIIKKGETVRFVNSDVSTHILASMPFIGEGGIFSSNLEMGQKWEHKFEKPGMYYYLCFIHKSMTGKITVEDAGEGAKEPLPAK